MVEGHPKIISFRLSLKEFKEAQRIASLVSIAGKIPNDRVATLAKACLFVRINEWILIEAMEKAIEERDEALKGSTRTIPPAGYG